MADRIGFVVLNYVNYDETVRCVESILNLPASAPIIVVDNCSPNDSFEHLQSRFSSVPAVTVIHTGRNGGYSMGNNFGIRTLRQMGIDNVVIATSDTRIESLNLVERCLSARDAGIAVVGPFVMSDEPGSSNPLLHRLTLQYIAAIKLGWLWTLLKNTAFSFSLLKPRTRVHGLGIASICTSALHDVYMLHGCFLFLSEHYLCQFPQLDEDIFMYGEEDLIAYNCIHQGLRMVYDPAIRIYHGDSKSTSPGDFRLRESVQSMATLRRKLSLFSLLHAYFRSR